MNQPKGDKINGQLNTTPLCSSRYLETNENDAGNKISKTQTDQLMLRDSTKANIEVKEGPIDFSVIADPRLSLMFSQLTMNGEDPLASRKITDIAQRVSGERLLRDKTDHRAEAIKEGMRERRKYLITKLLGYPYC